MEDAQDFVAGNEFENMYKRVWYTYVLIQF